MLTKDEATKIATAINAARPDWSIPSLMAVLGDKRCRTRAYRDLFLAFCALALDPASLKPTRIYGEGPWWEITRPVGGVSASAWIQTPTPSDCDICGRPPNWRHIDHVYQPRDVNGRGTPKPDELDELIAATAHTLTAKQPEETP
jgi:hypothetical protein